MEDDKVTRFIDTRDEHVLEDCTKAQLQSIADHFGIKLRSSRVGERRLEIMAQLRARDEALGEERQQTPASVGEHLSIGGSSRGSSGSRRSVKLEILKLQLEAQLCKEEREQEAQLCKEEREAEAQLRKEEREAQLRKEEREHEAQLRREERELEARLKQQEVEANKEVDLKRAELGLAPPAPPQQEDRRLTPECYRKRFRECTRSPGKSYVETAREMKRKFLKWLESEGAKSAEDVKRLMVLEKFMSMLSPEIRVRVKEADIKDLRAAADRADMLEEVL
ncbi:uncharacterized protein [Procambarus clarkii]|uniref:uncharacterized protein n=1 Tax=Procambarus clarkii TaxID=6728 RepID=UPI003743599B